MHLHKKGVLAEAPTEEKGADRVPCWLHGLYNEARPELKGKNRRRHQYGSKGKLIGNIY